MRRRATLIAPTALGPSAHDGNAATLHAWSGRLFAGSSGTSRADPESTLNLRSARAARARSLGVAGPSRSHATIDGASRISPSPTTTPNRIRPACGLPNRYIPPPTTRPIDPTGIVSGMIASRRLAR